MINFHLLFGKYREIEDEESTTLLMPEEEFVKHHGSILPHHFISEDPILPDIDTTITLSNCFFHIEVRDELTAILRFAIPLVVTFILGVSNRAVDTWFLGKIGSEGNQTTQFTKHGLK